MSNGKKAGIDWDFIGQLEGGSRLEGYIPTDREGAVVGKSGLTIGTGWDVGQMSSEELMKSGLPENIINAVSPYVGLKGQEALSKFVESGAPKISEEQANLINQYSHQKTLNKLSENYKKTTGKDFSDLSANQQTALASVGFQYGPNLGSATPGFWGQATAGDWGGAYENLMDFGDKYPTRRKKEAALLSQHSPIASLRAGGKIEDRIVADMLQREEGIFG